MYVTSPPPAGTSVGFAVTLTLIRPSDEDASFPAGCRYFGVVTSGAACAVWIRGNIPTAAPGTTSSKRLWTASEKSRLLSLPLCAPLSKKGSFTRMFEKRLKQMNFAWDIHPPPPACLAENYDAAYHLGKKGVQLG